MSSLSGARELYMLDRAPSTFPVAILVPDSTGVPTLVEPGPILLRAAYLPLDFVPGQLDVGRNRLLSSECDLFAPLESSDGPPYRTGVIFEFVTTRTGITWLDGNSPRHGGMAP